MSDAPVDPRFFDFGKRIEAAKLRLEGGRSELMALVMLNDQQGVEAQRAKMHDLLDSIMDTATEAMEVAKQSLPK